MKITKKNVKKKNQVDYKWLFIVTICAFIISFGFSALSELIIPNVSVIIAVVILILFILLGIAFDMIGVAVTVCNPAPFHSMATKRVKGAVIGVKLIKNADKVASFCNDVIGDICGIMSGATGVTIAATLIAKLQWNPLLTTLTLTALIAAFTIGGKAMGKVYAMKQSSKILLSFSKVISIFYKG